MPVGTRYAPGTQETGYKKTISFIFYRKTNKATVPWGRNKPGTCSFVPPVAGFILAAHVLRTILEVPEQ